MTHPPLALPALHVPDGFLDGPTSIATAVLAAGAVLLAILATRRGLAAGGPALPGLVAAFVFAAQMVNFPVGAGTSGHLIGAALAVTLAGPAAACLVLTAVLVVQALLFADGGLTALGTNVVLMAVVAVGTAALVNRLLTGGGATARRVVLASGIGAFLSVPAAALAFVGLYLLGGAVPVPGGALAATMLGWHLVIGVGEAVLTAAVVGAVAASRPDLVHALRHTRVALEVRPPRAGAPAPGRPADDGAAVEPVPAPARRRSARSAAGVALGVTLVVAGGVSLLASGHPDGLEFVAGSLGFAGSARESATAGSPLADYAASGLGALATPVAGIVGVLVTLAVALLVVGGARRRGSARAAR